MTERSYPWDGTSIGDASLAPYDAATEFAYLLQNVGGASGGRFPGNVSLGGGVSFFGDPALAGDPYAATNPGANTLRIAPGSAYVYGTLHRSDANVDINIPTPASAKRYDLIVLRKSWSAQTVRITRIAGTEGSGAFPATTNTAGVTWDHVICGVSINTSSTVVNVSDGRTSISNAFPVYGTLGANVTMGTANTFFTGPSVTIGNGYYDCIGKVIVRATTASNIVAKMVVAASNDLFSPVGPTAVDYTSFLLPANGIATLTLVGPVSMDVGDILGTSGTTVSVRVASDTNTATILSLPPFNPDAPGAGIGSSVRALKIY